MGTFRLDLVVASPAAKTRSARVGKALVDTGSEFTWIPGAVLHRAGIQVVKRDLPFVMANGQQVTRSTGYAILRSGDFETVDEVVFGLDGDLALLGARTLEGFGASVDPRRKRLVAAGPRSAAVAAVIRKSLSRNSRALTRTVVLSIVKQGRTEFRRRKARVIGSSAELQ